MSVLAETSERLDIDAAPHISGSWHRARLAGLTPSGPLTIHVSDVERESPLLRASGTVLDELTADLRGTGMSMLLADKDCRLVRRWCADSSVEAAFDSLNLVDGVSVLEENIGTNALGTAMEIRGPVTVNGEDHFVEPLKDFSCYGHPIRNPLTRRFEGVLDISMLASRASLLVSPLVARAVRDIERCLLDRSGASERALLEAFRRASVQRRRPVVALGADVLLTNRSASDLLCATDLAVLRVLADEIRMPGTVSRQFELESGRSVSVQITRLAEVRNAVLVQVDCESARASSATRTAGHFEVPAIRTGDVVLVSGPPGSGRTSRARERLAGQPTTWLGGASATLDGAEAWAQSLMAAAQDGSEAICIDDVDLLPDQLLDAVTRLLDRPRRPPLVLTSTTVPDLRGRVAILVAAATDSEELLPLAARRADIPGIAAHMLRTMVGAALQLSPGVLQALSSHSWPGNLSELERVVAQAACRRSVGALVLDDLPEPYRLADRCRLNVRDQAERDVILAALRAFDGNKVKAARELSMSRTTLYARMRSLKISTY